MNNHTPGPWHVTADSGCYVFEDDQHEMDGVYIDQQQPEAEAIAKAKGE